MDKFDEIIKIYNLDSLKNIVKPLDGQIAFVLVEDEILHLDYYYKIKEAPNYPLLGKLYLFKDELFRGGTNCEIAYCESNKHEKSRIVMIDFNEALKIINSEYPAIDNKAITYLSSYFSLDQIYTNPVNKFLAASLNLIVSDFLYAPEEFRKTLVLKDIATFANRILIIPPRLFTPLQGDTLENPIREVLKYIRENYLTANISQLAKELNYNKDYLSSLISKTLNTTFKELIKYRRMIVAAGLIIRTNKTLEEVCHDVGYSSYSTFYRYFKEYHGISPKEFILKVDESNNKN